MRRLYRITAPHFVAGIEVEHTTEGDWEWKVVKAAPIVGYMQRSQRAPTGWGLEGVGWYCEKQDWLLELIGEEE